MTLKEDHLFGRLALHYKVLTRDQLTEALKQQSREGGGRKIGEILIERGWLSHERFEQLLLLQRRYQGQAGATPDAETAAVEAPGAPEAGEAAAGGAGEGRTLVDWLAEAARRGASDLHVHAGQPIRIRRHGDLELAAEDPLDGARAAEMVSEILSEAQRRTLAEAGQVDLATTIPGVGRVRGSVYRQQHGTDGVFRIVPELPPTLSDLGLPLDLARFANFHQGLVLVTGPSGCGKSSTLAALVNLINDERRDHVITIEDPVEYVHTSRRAIVNQRQVGVNTGSFARALRAALREDPDVIVVGELRDLETISLALTAAETGHLVLGTLHTSNALATVNRLVGVFPPSQQPQIRAMLSESLRAIVCQRLARRADGGGRVPVLEILVADRAVSNLIRENKVFQIRSVLQTGSAKGMRTLEGSLEELVRGGVVTSEEARRHSEAPEPGAGDGGSVGRPGAARAGGSG